MTIRRRLLTQYIVLLAATVAITVIVSYLFSAIYLRVHETEDISRRQEDILLADDTVVGTSLAIGVVGVREILLNESLQQHTYTLDGITYNVAVDKYTKDNTVYTHIKLSPHITGNDYYSKLILTTILSFVISFAAGLCLLWHYNGSNLARPMEHLRTATNRLVEGDLTTPVAATGDSEVRALGIAVETLRRRLKDTAAEHAHADENRKFLVSSISHDLKTPVTALRGYVEGVRDGVADTPEKRALYLDKAILKTELLTRMIDDLLLYSRLDMQQITFTLERTDIAAYMADIATDAAAESTATITFHSDLAPNTTVWIDRTLFARVVQNIIDNAKKYSGEDCVVQISLYAAHSAVILEVRDNGCGIPKADIEKVFERFYRADNARTAGGGLGLAIARQMVEGMGGRIWAVSTEGEGTSIRISLPEKKGADKA